MHPVILLGGFGRSGTAAIHEIFRAHPDIYTLPGYEFRLLTDPDGLLSLESALVQNWNIFQSDFALKRFKDLYFNLGSKYKAPYLNANYKNHFNTSYHEAIKYFLSEIGAISYRGVWAGNSTLFKKITLKILNNKRYRLITNNINYCSPLKKKQFYKISKNFIQMMHGDKMESDNKSMILINEPSVSQNANRCLKIVGSSKMIVVYRDPRDVYCSFQSRNWNPIDLKTIVRFQMDAYRQWENEKENLAHNSYIEIKFEDLIYNLGESLDRLSDFAGLQIDKELVKNSNFSVNKSNVGRWKKQLSNYEKDVINKEFDELLKYRDYL